MKKLLIVLAAVVVTATSYGQGFINFSTHVSAGVDAPIWLPDGSAPGPSYSAAMYLVSGGGVLTLLPDSITPFRSGLGSAYVLPTVFSVPGVPHLTPASFVLRAWETAAGSYEAAASSTTFAWGQSPELTITPTEPLAFPADLPASFTGFTMVIIPEPATICLFAAGAAFLLWRRRT